MRTLSSFIGSKPARPTPEPIVESVTDNSWHKSKSNFHNEAAEFHRRGGDNEAAEFHDMQSAYHRGIASL